MAKNLRLSSTPSPYKDADSCFRLEAKSYHRSLERMYGCLLVPVVEPMRLGSVFVDLELELFRQPKQCDFTSELARIPQELMFKHLVPWLRRKARSGSGDELEAQFPTAGESDRQRQASSLVRAASVVFRHLRRQERRLVIVGGPGCGKSSLLRYWATRRRFASPPGIYVELPKLRASGLSFAEYLGRDLTQLGGPTFAARVVSQLLPSGRVDLFCDGLDEVLGSAGAEPLLADMLLAVSHDGPGAVVFACREHYFEMQSLPTYRVLRVLPVSKPKKALLVRRIMEPSKAREFLRAVELSPYLRAITDTPLLLTYCAVLWMVGGELTESATDMIRRLIPTLIGYSQWREIGSVSEFRPSDRSDATIHAVETLQEIAFRTHVEGRLSFDTHDVPDWLLPLLQRSGMLHADSPGKHRFAHLALQETLAADSLLADPETAAAIAWENPWWRRVAASVLRVPDVATELIELIVRRLTPSALAEILVEASVSESDIEPARLRKLVTAALVLESGHIDAGAAYILLRRGPAHVSALARAVIHRRLQLSPGERGLMLCVLANTTQFEFELQHLEPNPNLISLVRQLASGGFQFGERSDGMVLTQKERPPLCVRTLEATAKYAVFLHLAISLTRSPKPTRDMLLGALNREIELCGNLGQEEQVYSAILTVWLRIAGHGEPQNVRAVEDAFQSLQFPAAPPGTLVDAIRNQVFWTMMQSLLDILKARQVFLGAFRRLLFRSTNLTQRAALAWHLLGASYEAEPSVAMQCFRAAASAQKVDTKLLSTALYNAGITAWSLGQLDRAAALMDACAAHHADGQQLARRATQFRQSLSYAHRASLEEGIGAGFSALDEFYYRLGVRARTAYISIALAFGFVLSQALWTLPIRLLWDWQWALGASMLGLAVSLVVPHGNGGLFRRPEYAVIAAACWPYFAARVVILAIITDFEMKWSEQHLEWTIETFLAAVLVWMVLAQIIAPATLLWGSPSWTGYPAALLCAFAVVMLYDYGRPIGQKEEIAVVTLIVALIAALPAVLAVFTLATVIKSQFVQVAANRILSRRR